MPPAPLEQTSLPLPSFSFLFFLKPFFSSLFLLLFLGAATFSSSASSGSHNFVPFPSFAGVITALWRRARARCSYFSSLLLLLLPSLLLLLLFCLFLLSLIIHRERMGGILVQFAAAESQLLFFSLSFPFFCFFLWVLHRRRRRNPRTEAL